MIEKQELEEEGKRLLELSDRMMIKREKLKSDRETYHKYVLLIMMVNDGHHDC